MSEPSLPDGEEAKGDEAALEAPPQGEDEEDVRPSVLTVYSDEGSLKSFSALSVAPKPEEAEAEVADAKGHGDDQETFAQDVQQKKSLEEEATAPDQAGEASDGEPKATAQEDGAEEKSVDAEDQAAPENEEEEKSFISTVEGGDKTEEGEAELLALEDLNTSMLLLMDAEDVLSDEEMTKYIYVEETVMDDLGKEVKVRQKVPILREVRKFERVSVTVEGEEGKTHKFLETITKVIKKSELNEEGELEEKESEIVHVIEHEERPEGVTIYAKRVNEKGEIEEVEVPLEDEVVAEPVPDENLLLEARRKKVPSSEKKPLVKKKVLKLVKELQVEPCSLGKVQEVVKPTIAEIEVVEDDSDSEDYLLDDEGLTEEEQLALHEHIMKKKEAKIAKLKDNLRTVLVRLALAEKKRNLYMQLISISSEVKEDILNPPDPDKPAFKVPKKVKTEDKFRRMYTDKLMEYRELRSAILVKLAMEKKRKEEVKNKYDVIASEVAHLRKVLEDKLHASLNKLLPKNDPVFKNQSPQAMVKRFLELLERLDNETKELMYKKKQMYLAKQKYDEVTENEQGLSYKYSLANKELKDLVSKNDRRNEKLEALKITMQKECLAITHINQKCEAILKTTDEKNAKLLALNLDLNRARQDRKDVHQARRKVEAELKVENSRIKLKNHPSLLKEYQLVQDLLRSRQDELLQLKTECHASLDQIRRLSASHHTSSVVKNASVRP